MPRLFTEALKLSVGAGGVDTEVLISGVHTVLAVVTHQAVGHALCSSPACEQR